MDQNRSYRQLNREIEKLKMGDYTSYQSFYNMTSDYLYQILLNNVQNQSIAYDLIDELYTDIYTSIDTELTDNSRFFEWAGNKAQSLSTTYLMTHNMSYESNDRDKKIEEVAMFAATNAGIDSIMGSSGVAGAEMSGGMAGAGMSQATGGMAGAGMSQATGGMAGAGMSQASGGAANMGMSQVSGGAANMGMSQASGGATNMGMGQVSRGMGQMANEAGYSGMNSVGSGMGQSGMDAVASRVGQAGAGKSAGAATGTAAKTGMSLGAKIAISAGVAVALIGAGVGTFFAVNSNKDKERNTEVISEALSTEEIIPAGGKEDATEEVVENLETDKAERYAAYYDIVKTYMQDYPYQPVFQDENTGFLYAKLVDFNHEDKEQLIIAYSEAGTDAWYDVTYTVKIFDYANGQATEVTTINTSKIGFSEEEGSIALWTTEGPSHWSVNDLPESYKVIKTMYKYEGGSFVANHTYIEEVIIKDDYSFEVESETGYVDNEVRPVDEVRALISSIDERSDNYEFNTIIEANAKPLLTKHATMDLLAEVSGDAEFVNAVSDVEASVEADGPNYTYTYSANKYNESYALAEYSPNSAPETSADFMTVRSHCVSTGMELREDGDVCYTFYHDVLLVTGYKDYRTDTYYWADEEAYLKHLIYPMNDDSNIVTVDEYNANVQALIN